MPLSLPQLALIGPLGPLEVIVIGILGVLIFGKRLPEVGRSIGKGIVEFKKGLQGIDDDSSKQPQAPKKLEDTQSRAGTQVNTETNHESTHANPSA